MAIKAKKSTSKQVDEFVSLSDRILKEVVENRRFVIAAFLSIILAFSISYIYTKHRMFKKEESLKKLSLAVKAYHELKPQSKKEETDNVIKKFDNVIKDFKETLGASYAQLYKGHIKYKNDNFKEAESLYKNVLNLANRNSKVYILAKKGIANTYIALKKYEKALALLNEILLSKNIVSKRNIYMIIANTQEESGDKKAAAKTLQKVITKFPDNPEIKDLENRIKKLTPSTINTP